MTHRHIGTIKGRIIEIFDSIQGEGLWVGKPQVFVRFYGCKRNCSYCDTKQSEKNVLEFSKDELSSSVAGFKIPSIAITGGEPLEQADFLCEWLKSLNGKYETLLETNGIEVEGLKKVISFVDMIGFDIKIPSATKEKSFWEVHDQFAQIAGRKSCYAKIIFDENMKDDEVERVMMILNKYPNLIAVFQPVSPVQKRDLKKCLNLFRIFSEHFPERTRLIPQMHKILNVP